MISGEGEQGERGSDRGFATGHFAVAFPQVSGTPNRLWPDVPARRRLWTMDVTRTIRYEGPSYQDARLLHGMLENHGVHVEPAPTGRERRDELAGRQQQERRELVQRQQRELEELQAKQDTERRELVERQQQERAGQPGVPSAVTQVNHVVIDLESTGPAVAITAAVTSFRNLALAGKVEVEGEEQNHGDNSG
jgi:hypothetical protein